MGQVRLGNGLFRFLISFAVTAGTALAFSFGNECIGALPGMLKYTQLMDTRN